MADSVNLDNLRVDSDTGRVTVSGISSGIDTEGTVNSIIEAKRIPIDRIEAKITKNQEKISTLKGFDTLFSELQAKANALRGIISLDAADNIFESKEAYAGTSRSDGGTASAAGELLGVTLSNAAETGTHEIEIVQRASAHKVTSFFETSLSVAPGFAGSFKLGTSDDDTVDVNFGPLSDIDILATDTLATIRDKINAANTGADPSGVTASIVQGSAGNGYLVLTADNEGEQIQFQQTGGADVLLQLGLHASGAGKNTVWSSTLSDYEDAILHVDNIYNEGEGMTSGYLANTADILTTGEIYIESAINPVVNATIGTAGTPQSIDDYLADIAALPGDSGVTAYTNDDGNPYYFHNLVGDQWLIGEVIEDSVGNSALHVFITRGDGSGNNPTVLGEATFENTILPDDSKRIGVNMTFESDADETTSGFEKTLLDITRSSNTIDDLLEGATLDLLAAEEGTTIELEVRNSLTDVKQAISDFVDAYNAIITGLNEQRSIDDATGKPVEEATLFGTAILGQMEAQLSLIMADVAQGDGLVYTSLAEIGIEFVDNDSLTDPLNENTLEIDETALDNALLNNFDDVKKLFTFEASSSDARFEVLSYNEYTDFANEDVTLDVNFNVGPGEMTSATVTIDGQVYTGSINNRTISFDDGPVEGLKLYFNGDMTAAATATSTLTSSRGLGVNLYYDLDRIIDEETGSISSEINSLEDVNELNSERVQDQLSRLAEERQRLMEKFYAMEEAMAQLASLEQQITSIFEGMNGDS